MLLALAGFATFSVGDGIVKSMAGQFPGDGVAMLRYVIGAAGLGLIVLCTRGRAGFSCPRPGLQLARALAVALASVGFFMGVQFMPLAAATSIQFTTPMLAAVFSTVILGERAPLAVWVATALAFTGVIIVLQPQLLSLGMVSLYPLAAALGMALLMIFNRMAGGLTPLLESQFLITVIAAPILIAIGLMLHLTGLPQFRLHLPGAVVIFKCACVAVTGTASHWLLFMATQRASAALTAPMMYVQMLMATTISIAFFHAIPTGATFFGAAIIIAGGLYLGWDTQRRKPRS
jgi:drug/metabolite transporter (DMT)-like permease